MLPGSGPGGPVFMVQHGVGGCEGGLRMIGDISGCSSISGVIGMG